MQNYISKLSIALPGVKFIKSDSFHWSPKNQTISYIDLSEEQNVWALLHEAAHAVLEHMSYQSDFELLKLEVSAWDQAKKLGEDLGHKVDEEHIQDCLDTYRDWLHQRSTCPSCSSVCLQASPNQYRCHNCYTVWNVSNSRFCRPYRLRTSSESKKSPGKTQTTFA